jgi:hypothetical protein
VVSGSRNLHSSGFWKQKLAFKWFLEAETCIQVVFGSRNLHSSSFGSRNLHSSDSESRTCIQVVFVSRSLHSSSFWKQKLPFKPLKTTLSFPTHSYLHQTISLELPPHSTSLSSLNFVICLPFFPCNILIPF